MLSGKNILLGITGGIAAYKSTILIRLLIKQGASVKVVVTPAAKQFVTPLTLSTLSNHPLYSAFSNHLTGEWNSHVELGNWADLFVIAPATANTIAKMANGICDNLLLASYFSAKCSIYISPAMDLEMYLHPSVKENLNKLNKFGNFIIPARNGELASGLVGKGRMEEPEEILAIIEKHFAKKLPLAKKKILITAGSTHEQIDPVRFIGNNSSGKMGIELAEQAISLGAEVTLIIGPTHLQCSSKINRINVVSAKEMFNHTHKYFKHSAITIMSAAVADYTPNKKSATKIKKKTSILTIDLKPTQDILKSLGKIKTKKQLLVGFALETSDEAKNALKKLKLKNLDFIVLNSLRDKGAGFGFGTNKITIFDKNNIITNFELKPKSEVAIDIFNKILSLLR